MIAVVDYGMGNLRSVRTGIERAGGEVRFARSAADLESCSGLVLPGVGAFGKGMENLRRQGLVDPLRSWAESARPMLSICLGMQLLFDRSMEQGVHDGLGIMAGKVERFGEGLKVPQLGWNSIIRSAAADQSPYSSVLPEGTYFYFAHSYFVAPEDESVVVTSTEYGRTYASVVGRGGLIATQFHPEKSGPDGLCFLERFVELTRSASC